MRLVIVFDVATPRSAKNDKDDERPCDDQRRCHCLLMLLISKVPRVTGMVLHGDN